MDDDFEDDFEEEVEIGRDEILAIAADLIGGERQELYGDAVTMFRRLALMWTAIIQPRTPITPLEVVLCMLSMKAIRATESPDHMDNYIDMAGYAALAGS